MKLVFPTPASPFVAIAQNANDQGAVYTVQDLRDGRQSGTVTLNGDQYGSFTLSPDGLYLASYLRADSHNILEVWSVAQGRSLRVLDLKQRGYPVLFHYVFVGPGLLLTTQSGRTDDFMRIWDVATGKCLRQFQVPMGTMGIRAYAVSPGGRYLAVPHRKSDHLVICDLTAGKVIGEWRIPVPNRLMYRLCWAVAFSQDGQSLYVLYFCGLEFFLAQFDVGTGKARTQRLKGWGDLSNPLFSGDFETGPLLQCLADGSLMLASYLVINPTSGRVVRKLVAPAFQGDVRRVIGAKWAVIAGPPGGRQLLVHPCPPP